MGKWEFYDDYEEVEGEEKEPSFSLYDFKKWLETHHKPDELPSLRDSVENKKRQNLSEDKDALKAEFTQRVKERVQRNIDRKLSERNNKQ